MFTSTRKIKDTSIKVNDKYPPTSRYKNTNYYERTIQGIGTFVEPETWNPPDFTTAEMLTTVVQPGEEGRLDIISLRLYRSQFLWWVIAYVNNIIDPFEEIVSGKELIYPRFDYLIGRILS